LGAFLPTLGTGAGNEQERDGNPKCGTRHNGTMIPP
jgi:hypothetical protein